MVKIKNSVIASVVLVGFVFLVFFGAEQPAFAASKIRKYYLTQDPVSGSQPLTACDEGFHMASFYEIFDITVLRYDTDRGFANEDSGFGPPTGGASFGWIRTGYDNNSTFQTPGVDNCEGWTINDDDKYGTAVLLTNTWDSNPTATSPWRAFAFSCSVGARVWCVQD